MERQGEKGKYLWQLFVMMLKIGLFTFGGGWSIVGQMQDEFVGRRGWLDEEELLDTVSIGRSMPGIMVVNISVLFGYKMCGLAGALVCAFGVVLPSVVVLSVVTLFYSAFRDNAYVSRAMVGVRAAVVPIILSAALKLRGSALQDKFCWLLASAAFLLCLFTRVSNLWVVLLGAAAGLIYRGRRGDALS